MDCDSHLFDSRIEKDLADWKKEQESFIQVKDRRSDLIQKEKDLTIQQVSFAIMLVYCLCKASNEQILM